MGHSNFFRFVPMGYVRMETLERMGGEYQTQPLHLSRGKLLWPTSAYIYGTRRTLVPVKNRLFADQYHMIISMAQVSNPSRV